MSEGTAVIVWLFLPPFTIAVTLFGAWRAAKAAGWDTRLRKVRP